MRWPGAVVMLGVVGAMMTSINVAAAGAISKESQGTTPSSIRVPYSGTAELSFTLQGDLMPARAASDLGRTDLTSHFWVQDSTHYRIDLHRSQPVLESGNQTVVGSGTSVIIYNNVLKHAVQLPPAEGTVQTALAEFTGVPYPTGVSAQTFVDNFKNNKAIQVRLVGQEVVVGRLADVIDTSPVVEETVGPCSNAQQCRKRPANTAESASGWITKTRSS
jgi:hypothetical protein